MLQEIHKAQIDYENSKFDSSCPVGRFDLTVEKISKRISKESLTGHANSIRLNW